jgi:hypothetical protein
LEEILDSAVKELAKKNLVQGKEIVNNILTKNPTQTTKKEWIELGELTAWFFCMLILKITIEVIRKKFYIKDKTSI